ncbi:MAG: hypothetical protein IPM55_13440 [Acidobacteria bacterium]|nr:hypothetical protein [Acidobacteriota bacterium]
MQEPFLCPSILPADDVENMGRAMITKIFILPTDPLFPALPAKNLTFALMANAANCRSAILTRQQKD